MGYFTFFVGSVDFPKLLLFHFFNNFFVSVNISVYNRFMKQKSLFFTFSLFHVLIFLHFSHDTLFFLFYSSFNEEAGQILIKMENLTLDSGIRNWVFIPIFLIMFLVGMLQNNITKLFYSNSQAKLSASKLKQL